MRIGANLAGMQQNQLTSQTFHIPPRLATRDSYTDMHPGSSDLPVPAFHRHRARHQLLRASDRGEPGRQALLQRDGSCEALRQRRCGRAGRASACPSHSMQHVQGDWRNCHPALGQADVQRICRFVDAALAMNEGSQAPNFLLGTAVGDLRQRRGRARQVGHQAAVHLADNGYFFSADTIDELAKKIYTRHEFQRVPLKHLKDTDPQVEHLRGRGQRSRFRARQGRPDAQDRQAAVLRRRDLPGVARLLWRPADQRQGSGPRHAGRGDPGPLSAAAKPAVAATNMAWAGPWSTASSPAPASRRSAASAEGRMNSRWGLNPTGVCVFCGSKCVSPVAGKQNE